MRFYEYESRRIVERAGIPVTDYGFATTPAEARDAAQRIGGPTVIKSQVLTGGRMKAGGVKFADTPAEAEAHAAEILELEIGGHMPVGVLVDPKAEIEQEYYAAVLWDGRAKRPMMLFSDMGGIDIEQVAAEHPDRHVAADLELEDLSGVGLGLLGRVGELDAARLHPPAGEHLGLDHGRTADLLGSLAGLLGGRAEAVLRHRDSGALDQAA